MNDSTRFDAFLDEEVERALAAYASARLTPDHWTTNRMRVALIEHARTGAPIGRTTGRSGSGGVGRFRFGLLRLAPIALVAAVAVTVGSAAGVAASPGGPLYGLRVQIETALLPSGADRPGAQLGLLTERTNEITDAVQSGNQAGVDAAGQQYSDQLDHTVTDAVRDPANGGPTAAQIAAQRADLLLLQAALQRQITHLETIAKMNDPSTSNVQKLIAKTEASLDVVNAKLAALPTP